MGKSNKSIVNGIVIEGDHQSISVINGKIYVDGKPYQPEETDEKVFTGQITITVNGNVREVDGTNININGNVSGDVDRTNITISGDVGGDVDGTNVTIKRMK